MKTFKEKFNKVLNDLKLYDKAKKGELKQEDWDAIAAAYTKEHKTDFYDDQEKSEADERRGSIHQAALNLLNDEADPPPGATTTKPVLTAEELEARKKETPEMKLLREKNEAAALELDAEKKKTTSLTNKVIKLENSLEKDEPKTIVMKIGLMGGKTTDKFLFGIDHPLFAMDKRWNKISANKNFALTQDVDENADGKSFREAVTAYAANFTANYQKMHESGATSTLVEKFADFFKTGSTDKLSAGLDVDYSDLGDTGLGEQYVILRQEALAARILMVPTVYHLFPRRYGIQDRDIITNAFFGEYSQAQQLGEVWKGDMNLQPEVGHVDDAMYKTLFNSMKWIERQYIGYLNKEGSDPIKWTMIEWMLLNIATVLTNEASQRKILGQYIKPVTGTPGNKMHASTGVIYTLLRYIHENKILALDDAAYNTYSDTSTVYVDAVDAFLAAVMEKRDNLDGLQLYLNKNHSMWYKSSIRRKYGKDFDFTGPEGDVVPDWGVKINWVPNMQQYKYMFLSKPGNIQSLENVPGEMYKIGFQPDMETVKSWSNWKEGTAAGFVGKQFDTPALLLANDYALQELFINKPATNLIADATTCDGTANFWFRTIANTGATVLTDITGAVVGKAYIIECGALADASSISKAGKFSEITAAYTPLAVGDYLMVTYDGAKFHDMERRVNSVRSIVAAVQPNVPGVRQ